jgi:hypothetical protein
LRSSSVSDTAAAFFFHNGNEYDFVISFGLLEHKTDSGMSTHSSSNLTTRSSPNELLREGDRGGVIITVSLVLVVTGGQAGSRKERTGSKALEYGASLS